ncbi:MAG: O-methyltransferase [Bacteroidales bacterium]
MAVINQLGQRLVSGFLFWFHARGRRGHGIHSPFVFHLVTEVLNNKEHAAAELRNIEKIRKQLAGDKRTITHQDLGAGNWPQHIRIKDVVKKSVSPPKKLQVLYQLAHYLQPVSVIELGTSLGLSALTFARACPESRIITVEGSPSLALLAEENFKKLGVNTIDLRIADFDCILSEIVSTLSSPFLVYIDGNHRYRATVSYFNAFAERLDTRSCIIIDDIHWSGGMEKAWQEICLHSRSTFCLDFFDFGIIFYRENTAKTHYCLRY